MRYNLSTDICQSFIDLDDGSGSDFNGNDDCIMCFNLLFLDDFTGELTSLHYSTSVIQRLLFNVSCSMFLVQCFL